MLHLSLKPLLEIHRGLHLNKIYPMNLLLLMDFESALFFLSVADGISLIFFPIILQYFSTHFKDRWIFFSHKEEHCGGKNAGCDFKKCQNMSNADTTQGYH